MLKHLGKWTTFQHSSPALPFFIKESNFPQCLSTRRCSAIEALKLSSKEALRSSTICSARRRVRDEDEEEEEEEYGHNEEIALLELYSQSARGEALLVHAIVDEKQVEVLIFKGFSSCLSYGTSPDPSKSVLPARAAITSIDRIKGPFDPSNIEYIEKGLTLETFKVRLLPEL